MKEKVEEYIDQAPRGHFPDAVKNNITPLKTRIRKHTELIDDLGRRDASGAVYIDEASLRKLIRERSPRSEDALIAQLRNFPGNNLKTDTRGMDKIKWEDAAKKMWEDADKRLRPPDETLPPYASLEEIRRAVKRHFPNIPDSEFVPDQLIGRWSTAVGITAEGDVEAIPAAVWNCFLRRLGWFVAIAFVVLENIAWGLADQFRRLGIDNNTAFWTIMDMIVAVALVLGAVWALGAIISCVINPAG